MAKGKKSKVRKSATRPSEVSEWREYGSRGEAVDEAVGGAGSRPDEEELNAEYKRIKASIPEMSDWQAYVRAAQSRGDVQKSSDPLAGLADSLTALRTEARRAEMSLSQQQIVRKAAAEAELRYLRHVRPWSVPNDTELVRKAQDDDARIRKADAIQAADPSVRRFDAMRRAAS